MGSFAPLFFSSETSSVTPGCCCCWDWWWAGLDSSCILFRGNFDRQVGEGVEMWVVALPTVPCSRTRGQGIEDFTGFQLPYPRTGVGACWEWTLADPWPRTTVDLLLMLVERMNVS